MFVVLPKAQAARARQALARLEGLPRRATVTRDGVPDEALTAQLGSQLDTTDAVEAGDEDGMTACFDLPAALEKYLGRTVKIGAQSVTLPTAAELAKDEDALPETLKAVRQAKRDAATVDVSLGVTPKTKSLP